MVLVLSMVGLLIGTADNARDLIPLGLVTTCVIAFGMIMLIFARQWREMEAGILGRIMKRPIPVTPTDVFSYRAAAVLLVAGGCWLYFSA